MDIGDWLRGLGLEKYAEAFADGDIDADVLPDLTETDLERLGVSLGHRKKLMRAIAELAATSAQTASPPPGGGTAGPMLVRAAERRHLTVLFCDMVGSTDLAARLDPEDMAAVYRAYYECCERVVSRWEGHLHQFLGDGALIFFGYPQAHEDDAMRAAHAGLELIEALRHPKIETAIDCTLRARVGIATGLVLAGDFDRSDGMKGVVGDTVNLAARFQSLAGPDQVVIGSQTKRLLGAAFETARLGKRALKGFAEPVEVWRLAPAGGQTRSRFDLRTIGRLTPFNGREGEVATLERLWGEAEAGQGQIAIVRGEAGIGKSRLLREFSDKLKLVPHLHASLDCSPYHTRSAWHPVIEWIERAAGFRDTDDAAARLAKLSELLHGAVSDTGLAISLIAGLISIDAPEDPQVAGLSPQLTRSRTIEVLVAWIERAASRQPLFISVEDAHWLDPSTKDFLDAVAERIAALPVMLVVTTRPGFVSGWSASGNFSEIEMGRLDRSAASAMVRSLSGSTSLGPELERRLIAKADGVPLFLEELTRMASETSPAREDADGFAGGELGIPDTLKDLLTARLDRLGAAKEVAQMGAVIGREFGHDILSKAMGVEERKLEEAMPRLVAAELVLESEHGDPQRYVFKHALVRDAAYDSLPLKRRKALHRRLAEVIETDFPAIAQSQPELLAQHYAGAELAELSIESWLRAGRRAIERSAMVEAVEHLREGLRQLGKLVPGDVRDSLELDILRALAPALLVTKGYASEEARSAFERLRDVCDRVGDGLELFLALRGLWAFRFVRAELDVAAGLADQLLSLAGKDDALGIEAHRAIGMTALYLGDFSTAARHLEQGAALYDRERHHEHAYRYGNDPGVVCLSYGAKALWCLGHIEEAEARSRAALELASDLEHPFSRCQSLALAGMLAQHCRDVDRLIDVAEQAIASSEAYSFRYWFATGSILHAWALSQRGGTERTIEALDAALQDYRGSGAELATPWFMALGAEARGLIGDRKAALDLLVQAEERCEATHERYYLAEIHRLRGDLLADAAPDDAEAAYRRAIEVAEAQQARAWARRARISLARHLADAGRAAEARETLSPALGEPGHGEANPDAQEVRDLMDGLQ